MHPVASPVEFRILYNLCWILDYNLAWRTSTFFFCKRFYYFISLTDFETFHLAQLLVILLKAGHRVPDVLVHLLHKVLGRYCPAQSPSRQHP